MGLEWLISGLRCWAYVRIGACHVVMGKVDNLMGKNVSNPLAIDHGNPFFFASSWRFLAVMSMPSA
jgi:hypothetical protein